MTVPAPTRLPAAERRRALIETAVRVFSSSSYRGCTTAEIARAAGVSEPILYRHFESKRDLYLAAIDHVWQDVRRKWEAAIAEEPDPRRWLAVCADSYLAIGRDKAVLAELCVQALAEAWIFLSGGVLGPIGRRIGLLNDDDVARIRAARMEWLAGRQP